MRIALIVVVAFTFSSCATLFNAKRKTVSITTSEPSQVVVNGDSLTSQSKLHIVEVTRGTEPLVINALHGNLSKTIEIPSRNSFAYWLNAYPSIHLWTGFYIDTRTKRRYTYPRNVYIDMKDSVNDYLEYVPYSKLAGGSSNILRFSPTRILAIINPAVEVSYERRTGLSFATQVAASYQLASGFWDMRNGIDPQRKGYGFSLEEKFYFRKSAPQGPYVSIEFNFMKSNYKTIENFTANNELDPQDIDSIVSYADSIGIRKQHYGFNVKFGYQIIYKRFVFDIYTGLGSRHRDVIHIDRMKPEDIMTTYRHPNIYYGANREGKYSTPSFVLGVRVGWRF